MQSEQNVISFLTKLRIELSGPQYPFGSFPRIDVRSSSLVFIKSNPNTDLSASRSRYMYINPLTAAQSFKYDRVLLVSSSPNISRMSLSEDELAYLNFSKIPHGDSYGGEIHCGFQTNRAGLLTGFVKRNRFNGVSTKLSPI